METHSFYFYIGGDAASRQDWHGTYEACLAFAERFLACSTYDYYVHESFYNGSIAA